MSYLTNLHREKADLLMLKADIIDRVNFKKRIGQKTDWDEDDYAEVEKQLAHIEERMAQAMRQ